MYAKGDGVAQDGEEAVHWFREAADQGDASGQLNLAMAYWLGLGVPKDLIEAYLWATLSADQHNEEAQELQAAILKDMAPAQVSRAHRLARAWKAKALAESQKAKLGE
jgi:TPR repeat protein